MQETPKANRLHITIFGRRNVGKSSLINAITGQQAALVSDIAGTTTDPVYKAMELLPIGPVMFIDTAGLDDVGEIGELRIKKTKEVMDKTDLALLVVNADSINFELEAKWKKELEDRDIPIIGVINKCDENEIDERLFQDRLEMPFVKVSAKSHENIERLKEMIHQSVPLDYQRETITGDLVNPKGIVILVAPQDIQAPKGRLILPQVQVIRDLLDNNCLVHIVKDNELIDTLKTLNKKPELVITDSQVFKKVNSIIDSEIPLTSFSILMARYKGELKSLVEGARAIDTLVQGDKVLIAEACTHHALQGDIGREKLPKWLEEKVGGKLNIIVKAGMDFEEDLTTYKLVIHCGSCMLNKKQFISRIAKCSKQNIPITNYGIAIAHMNGILERVIGSFKEFK